MSKDKTAAEWMIDRWGEYMGNMNFGPDDRDVSLLDVQMAFFYGILVGSKRISKSAFDEGMHAAKDRSDQIVVAIKGYAAALKEIAKEAKQ